MNLDEKVNVELTVSEIVLMRDALRGYVEKLQGYVRDGLNKCDVPAAFVHEKRIAEAIEIFGKLCEEE